MLGPSDYTQSYSLSLSRSLSLSPSLGLDACASGQIWNSSPDLVYPPFKFITCVITSATLKQHCTTVHWGVGGTGRGNPWKSPDVVRSLGRVSQGRSLPPAGGRTCAAALCSNAARGISLGAPSGVIQQNVHACPVLRRPQNVQSSRIDPELLSSDLILLASFARQQAVLFRTTWERDKTVCDPPLCDRPRGGQALRGDLEIAYEQSLQTASTILFSCFGCTCRDASSSI